jgi:hypothetical protein
MKRFFDGPLGETIIEERNALFVDMRHLSAECERYGVSDNATNAGGVAGLMFRERERLLTILQTLS